MAKRYQKVIVTAWDGGTIRDSSDAARVLFFYLLTGPQTTLLTGILSVAIGTIAHKLRWSEEKTRATMSELVADGSVLFDEDAGVVWLPNALEHNPPANPNIVRGWEDKWNEVPRCSLKAAAYQVLRSWCAEKGGQWLASFDAGCKAPKLSARGVSSPQKHAVGNGYGNGSGNHSAYGLANGIGNGYPNQYQEQEQKQEQNLPPTPPGGGMRVRTHESAHEAAPATSPSGRVVAEVVSTEAPPSRQPPAPVEVTPPSPTPASAPSCPVVAPLAAFDAEDDDQPPPAVRCPSTPRPEPVAAVAPPAPVETAPVAPTPAPTAAPSGQVSLLDAEPAPMPAGRRRRSAPVADEADVVAVFDHWRETVWKGRAILNDPRRTRIAARLAEGFTVADLKRAADGATRDDWLMGRAEGVRAGGHRDVETVFRDAAQVERLMQLAPTPKAPPAPPVLRQPPPLPPHLAARAARMPVPTLADFLERGFAAPPSPRVTAAQIDAALAAKETAHAC